MPETKARKPRAKKGEGTQPPTPYVVLMLVKVKAALKIPDVIALDGVDELGADLYGRIQDGFWLPVGEAAARTEKAAITAVVGDAAGTFKAVAARSWRGGEERYEQTRMTSKPLD